MAKITKSQANDQELVVIRSRNTNKIERVIIPHDTQIGLTDFKDGDLTVLGRLIAKGPLVITNGAQGALTLPTGAHTLQAGSNITISYNPNGTVTIAGSAGGTLTDGDKGDITVSQSGNTWTIDSGVVANVNLANMANGTIKGRFAAGPGAPQDLTSAQATSLLDVFDASSKGLVPAPGNSVGKFLKDDATWATVSASPGGSSTQVQFNDGGSAFGGDAGLTYNKTTDTLTGVTIKATAFSGSLTKLSDGSDYLIAGSNISLTTGSNGSVTIATSGSTGNSSLVKMAFNESPGGNINGMNKVFTLANSPDPVSSTQVFYNGQLLTRGNGKDYNLAGSTITFDNTFSAPVVGDTIFVTYAWDQTNTTLYSYSLNEAVSFQLSGQSYVAALTYTPNPSSSVMLFMNGQLLAQGVSKDYTLSGATITLSFSGGVVGSDFFATYQY